ncbi:unnamed protein product [Urochloa humidicola]
MKTANSLQLATAQASLDRGTSSSSHVIPTGLPAFYLNVEVAMDIIPGREKDGEGVEADAGSVGMNGPYVEANIGRGAGSVSRTGLIPVSVCNLKV